MRLADCARAWLADSSTINPFKVAEYASGWSSESWAVVARRGGYDGEVTPTAIGEAIDELLGACRD